MAVRTDDAARSDNVASPQDVGRGDTPEAEGVAAAFAAGLGSAEPAWGTLPRWPATERASKARSKRAPLLAKLLVRLRGLEPPRRFQRYHLKVVRLPIPPQPQFSP